MNKLKRHWKALLLFGLCVAAFTLLLYPKFAVLLAGDRPAAPERSLLRERFEAHPEQWLAKVRDFSAFQADLEAGRVAEVGLDSGTAARAPTLLVTAADGNMYSVGGLSSASVENLLMAAERVHPFSMTAVAIDTLSPGERLEDAVSRMFDRIGRTAAAALPLVLIVFVVRYLMNDRKTLVAERPDADFTTVIGAAEAKAALAEVVGFLREPKKYEALGARPPRGVLLDGAPGTGKTLLARALAGESKASFIAIDGSHFSSMFFEQGIKRVSNLFATARAHAPCVIFIDEIDGIGARSSGPSRSSGQGEENRIINKLLVEMDGFKASEDVVVIAATNHRDNLDPALLRPGRFDQVCTIPMPNLGEREALFRLYIGKLRAAHDVAADRLARAATGSSPADIALVCNRAAIIAAERDAACVSENDLFEALESLQLGGRLSNVKPMLEAATRERIAYHEAGHAIVAHVAGAGVVGRISIEPRGQALGVTFLSRADETPLYGERELHAQLAMLLAGREAELLTYASTTSGAADDLKRASQLAMRMVTELGFSTQFGLMSLPGIPPEFVSSDTKERALEEARQLLASAQQRCRAILEQHQPLLKALSVRLLEDETVSSETFLALFQPDLELVA